MRANDVLADAGEPRKVARIVNAAWRHGLTTITTAFLRDNRLSLETRGMMACLAALPDDFEYTFEWMLEEFGISSEALEGIYAGQGEAQS